MRPKRRVNGNGPTTGIKLAFTIKEFCESTGIGRTKLYELWESGKGPARFKVGARTLIPWQAAVDWVEDCCDKGGAK